MAAYLIYGLISAVPLCSIAGSSVDKVSAA